MTNKAAKAAVNTSKGGYFIAMSAATRKVLSPISEKMIMVKASKKECRGWIIPLASCMPPSPVS